MNSFQMGMTYRFLATVEEASAVLDWFRGLPDKPVEVVHNVGSLFNFGGRDHSEFVGSTSPFVNVFPPKRKRGVLTTLGEVHFTTTPLSAVPMLKKINGQFRKWVSQFPCVYSHRPDFVHEWDYFLEGNCRNWDTDIFALSGGMSALRNGAYFVSRNDKESVLNRVCRALELRGVEGIVPQAYE